MKVIAFESVWDRDVGELDGQGLADRLQKLEHERGHLEAELAEGRLGVAQCHEIARAYANPRVRDQLGDVIEILLDAATKMAFEEFRTLVRRWETIADADGSHRSHETSHRNRRASMYLDETSIIIRAEGGVVDGAEMQAIFDRYQQAEYLADWEKARTEHGPRRRLRAVAT